MPFARQHLLVTFGGHQAGAEIWQCGVRFTTSAAGLLEWPAGGWNLSPTFLAIKTAFLASNISAGASLEWVKIALIKIDGKYETDPQDFIGTLTTGSILTLASGPQDSMCVSLWSGSSLGKGNHGRFYLPWNGTNVDKTTGKFLNTLIPGVAAAWVTCLKAIRTELNGQLNPATPVDISIVGESTWKKATHLRIGDVMDTQRRRRNKLREIYFDANL